MKICKISYDGDIQYNPIGSAECIHPSCIVGMLVSHIHQYLYSVGKGKPRGYNMDKMITEFDLKFIWKIREEGQSHMSIVQKYSPSVGKGISPASNIRWLGVGYDIYFSLNIDYNFYNFFSNLKNPVYIGSCSQSIGKWSREVLDDLRIFEEIKDSIIFRPDNATETSLYQSVAERLCYISQLSEEFVDKRNRTGIYGGRNHVEVTEMGEIDGCWFRLKEMVGHHKQSA